MKKFLSIISLIYFTIILYIILTNNLSNILAPRMHINIILGGIALFILSISSLFGHSHYKFKLIDLVLLVPIIMVILGGDFRLSSSLAGNRNRYVSNNSNNKYIGDTSINGDEKVDYVIDDDIYITATNLFSFGSDTLTFPSNSPRAFSRILIRSLERLSPSAVVCASLAISITIFSGSYPITRRISSTILRLWWIPFLIAGLPGIS